MMDQAVDGFFFILIQAEWRFAARRMETVETNGRMEQIDQKYNEFESRAGFPAYLVLVKEIASIVQSSRIEV